jgi:hypothetical protein
MHLHELFDADWNSYERKRFIKDDAKTKTDSFDPESFKHDGFDDRETYLQSHVPALAEEERLAAELSNFTPPRLRDINTSPYQALVIRYAILQTLIRQPNLDMRKQDLLDTVQEWQVEIIYEYEEGDFHKTDQLLHLSQAAVKHDNDIDDSELNLIYRFMEFHNQAQDWKHEYYTWEDVFRRLSTIDRFPKVSRSEKPEHAIDTIEKGLWSLQEQAIVYEIVDRERGDVVGIPEDYTEFIAEWLCYEMSDENYLTMLEALEPFDRQGLLIEASETFGIDRQNHGLNEKRRENIVAEGVYPTDLFDVVLTKEDLKAVVDRFGLDAHKRKRDEMVEATIDYFEQSQRGVEPEANKVDLFLEFYDKIADGKVDEIPPQLQGLVDEPDQSKKLEILFEEATAELFREIFTLGGTELLGQGASGTVADGEIEQDGKWLLWDNKRRTGEFKLGSTTRSKIKNYIDTKNQQHDVYWFIIIAPEFANSALEDANLMEKNLGGVNIRLVRADDFQSLARFWQDEFGETTKEFPLSMFNGSDLLNIDTLTRALKREFS